jgi:hypothetical protein
MMPILLDQFTGFPESKFAILTSLLFPRFQTMPLSPSPQPFSHRDWLFEVKWEASHSRAFPRLHEGLARDLKGRGCVLDGEIVCLDPEGKPQFRDLLLRRAEPS